MKKTLIAMLPDIGRCNGGKRLFHLCRSDPSQRMDNPSGKILDGYYGRRSGISLQHQSSVYHPRAYPVGNRIHHWIY